MTQHSFDARWKALDRVDRAERRFFSSPSSLPLWNSWSTMTTFTMFVIGLGILWNHVSRTARLILQAVDLSTNAVLAANSGRAGLD